MLPYERAINKYFYRQLAKFQTRLGNHFSVCVVGEGGGAGGNVNERHHCSKSSVAQANQLTGRSQLN